MSRYAPGLNIYSSVGTGFLYLSDSFAFDTRTGTTRVTMTSWAPGRHRKSITTQIYLSVVFVVALLFLSMEFYRLDEDIKQMKATIEEKVQLMADSYVTIVSGMLWSLNHDLMEPSLSGLMLVSGFDYATVTLPEGERLVSIGSPPPLGTVPDPGRNVCATRELNWQTAREVAYLGMLNICMNLDELKDYRDQHIKDALVSVAGIALGLGGFLFLVIRRITAPLVRITNSVEELSQGRRTAQIPFQHREDEVGTLARALDVFRRNDDELQSLRESLEAQVKLQTAELVNARDAAEAGNLAKSRFLSTMSHELRTPLTSMNGALKMLIQDKVELPVEKRKELLVLAARNADRLLALVNDVLDLQKIESGKMSYDMSALNLIELLRSTRDAMVGFVDKYQSRIAIDDGIGAPTSVMGDVQRMTQVLLNLLSNAVKFSPERSVIHVGLTAQGDSVKISVLDQGPGISEAFRPHLFQRFSQSSSGDRRQTGGTGLGLAIVKEIVAAHGGQIDVRNVGPEEHPEKSTGACFEVTLKRQTPLT